ncbi:TIGR01459 family HAD-type hydrolase [Maricaulis sp.]|uniref:TIGR01459 family HAD-type hydrolase n=1 Tax=Maricaulis sp. TaxID=1486257 RepID=UPI003A9242B8
MTQSISLPRPATLSQLRDRYDVLYCDVWGVIRDGRRLLPAAVDALVRFRQSGGYVCLVSNSPQRARGLAAMLDQMGLSGGSVDAIVTSGDAIHAELAARTPGRALRIGPEDDAGLYEGLAIEFTGIAQADFISCTGPDDYWNGKPEDYRAVLEAALERDLDLVCANPDIVVQSGDRLIYCAGAIARLYTQMGGRSIVAGKPHRPIYQLARSKAEASGRVFDPRRVLAIGDGPETDIAGAVRVGIDALFVADGIHGADLNSDSLNSETVAGMLDGYGVHTRWWASRLVWSDPSA